MNSVSESITDLFRLSSNVFWVIFFPSTPRYTFCNDVYRIYVFEMRYRIFSVLSGSSFQMVCLPIVAMLLVEDGII